MIVGSGVHVVHLVGNVAGALREEEEEDGEVEDDEDDFHDVLLVECGGLVSSLALLMV